jgi:hypothetical protein
LRDIDYCPYELGNRAEGPNYGRPLEKKPRVPDSFIEASPGDSPSRQIKSSFLIFRGPGKTEPHEGMEQKKVAYEFSSQKRYP